MNATARKGPQMLRRLDVGVADLSGGQRALYLALRSEAHRPTVRMTYRAFMAWLLLSSAIGLVTGFAVRG